MKINYIVTNYFPGPLSYSCPRLVVLVSSHIIGVCRVIPMDFSLAPTRYTVMVDVHAVSVGPSVFSNVTDVFTVHPLGFCLPLSVYRCSGTPIVSLVHLL